MNHKNLSLIMILSLLFVLISILTGAVTAYSTNYSADGKKVELTYDVTPSTLHYDVSSVYKNGKWGNGKYTSVIVTGQDNKGRNVYKKINYFNGLFRQSKTKISSEDYLYNCDAWIDGEQIKEKINGKLNSSITFRGSTLSEVGLINGQLVNKKGTATIGYWKNGNYYGKSTTQTTPSYQKIQEEYKIRKTSTITTTIFANKDQRVSYITSAFMRNDTGKLIGLKTSGLSRGTERIGSKLVSYKGVIYIKNRYDARDLYNEKFNTGNYYEQKTSTSKYLNKNIPLYEALLL